MTNRSGKRVRKTWDRRKCSEQKKPSQRKELQREENEKMNELCTTLFHSLFRFCLFGYKSKPRENPLRQLIFVVNVRSSAKNKRKHETNEREKSNASGENSFLCVFSSSAWRDCARCARTKMLFKLNECNEKKTHREKKPQKRTNRAKAKRMMCIECSRTTKNHFNNYPHSFRLMSLVTMESLLLLFFHFLLNSIVRKFFFCSLAVSLFSVSFRSSSFFLPVCLWRSALYRFYEIFSVSCTDKDRLLLDASVSCG